MPVTYTTLEDAKATELPVLVAVLGVPSPWGEAAKGMLYIKEADYLALPFDGNDDDQTKLTGADSAPCLLIPGHKPFLSSLDIMLAIDHHLEGPDLLPRDPMDRAIALGFAHEIFGTHGLSWMRRVSLIHDGLAENGGFPLPLAQYLAPKYGARHVTKETADKRAVDILTLFSDRLISQQSIGSPYIMGHTVTAVDIYLATAMALFGPLSQDQCPMHPKMRAAFSSPVPQEAKSILPRLLDHRDRIYDQHLEQPLSLGLAS